MNVSGRNVPTRVGVPAYSFTFSPHEIAFNEPAGVDGQAAKYSSDTAWYGRVFQRWDTPRLAVMTAVGMSGAAVSPAMGRFNRGSTGALLALANVRLGMWMPNPRYLGQPPADGGTTSGRRPGFPRRRLNYLVKEVFGVHDIGEPHVYVTDGGHWENLGVVELLRRHCTEVFCFDSSGSMTDSFGTLADAITLAAQELGVTIALGFEPLRALNAGGRLNRYVDRTAPSASQLSGRTLWPVVVRQGESHDRRARAAAGPKGRSRTSSPLPSDVGSVLRYRAVRDVP
jgi:hypothetical protein